MKSKLCIVFLFVFIKYGCSQKSWSLYDCINFALNNNLELLDYKYAIASKKETLNQSYRDFLPKINGYADFNIQYGRSIDPSNNSFINTNFFSNNYRVEASVDLFQSLKRIKTIKASKALFEASKNSETHQKYMIAFDVMSAYFDVLYFEELLTINKEQLVLAQQNYIYIKKQIELGITAGADLFEAKSTLFKDSLSVTQSLNSFKEAQLNLIQKMNISDVEVIRLQSSSIDEFILADNLLNIALETIYKKAINFVPDIKVSEFNVRAAEKSIDIARADLYPTAALFGGYGTGYFETFVDNEGKVVPFSDQIKNNAKQLVGVSLNIPIFSSWTSRSNIEQKKIELLQESNALEQKKQELRKTIQNLILEQRSLHEELKLSSLNIEAQKQAFLTAQKKRENGLISILEFNQAKNNYSKSLTENLLIKFQYTINKATLGFYYGLPVFKDLIKN